VVSYFNRCGKEIGRRSRSYEDFQNADFDIKSLEKLELKRAESLQTM
jgi:hypothetical protein